MFRRKQSSSSGSNSQTSRQRQRDHESRGDAGWGRKGRAHYHPPDPNYPGSTDQSTFGYVDKYGWPYVPNHLGYRDPNIKFSRGPPIPVLSCDHIPPRWAKSTLLTPYDREMAAKQRSMDTMNTADRKKQDEWAKSQLLVNCGNVCPQWTEWCRVPGGYRQSNEMVSDDLLAEGYGGCYSGIDHGRNPQTWNGGPFYAWEDVRRFVFEYFPDTKRYDRYARDARTLGFRR